MTLNEAIKHCLEVAEENDLAAGMYEILAEDNHNAYERLTEETKSSQCAECAAAHRQLAEWLTEFKEAKRLLKLAVTCLNDGGCTKDCDMCTNLEDCICERHDNSFKWRYTDEALKLIGDVSNA